MAVWLAEAGHEVRVIAAPPYYPDWAVWPGYSNWHYRRECWQGVAIVRAPLWVPRRVSGLKRVVHLASFAIASAPALFAQWRWKPDVVWLTEPPLACAPAALGFARLRGAVAWLHIQDFEIDAAFELGLLKGRRLRGVVVGIERWLMRRFDRISTISQRMLSRTVTKGVDTESVTSFPNWVDVTSIKPLTSVSPYRDELGIAHDAVVALYSGNMGQKQGLEIMSDAASLPQCKSIQFVFCGNGPGRKGLEQACVKLTNVRFLDLQPMNRLGELLGLADIHLLPQRADAADLVMPSKLTGMLSSGRPVVATAGTGTELATVVEQCGLTVFPGDSKAFADALHELASDPDRRVTLGRQARTFAEDRLAKEAVLQRFEQDLIDCVTQHKLARSPAA